MRMVNRLHVDEDMIDLHRILCPVDFSEPSLRALRHASAFAGWYEAALTALYVKPTLPIEARGDLGTFAVGSTAVLEERSTAVMQELRGFVKRAASDQAVDVELEEETRIADAIVARATSLPADLIVMGTHGRTAMSQLLVGSVAERVVRTAPCPVLTVRRPEHEFVIPDRPEKRDDHDSPQADTRRH